MPEARPRVVYITGSQHCGSTMLDAVLGNAPGAASLGEVGGFHRFAQGATCDCRQAAASCPPCRAVVERLGAEGALDDLARLSPLPLKERRVHWVMVAGTGRRRYAATARHLLEVASEALGAAVLVDSSKNVGRAAALALDSGLDVRVVHLVRDLPAYLESKRNRVGRPGVDRPGVGRLRATAWPAVWWAKNAAASALGRRLGPDRYLRVRFEDLVADPHRVMDGIGSFAGLDTTGLADRALGPGVDRGHLYEPRRQRDYRHVVIDRSRARPGGGHSGGRAR